MQLTFNDSDMQCNIVQYDNYMNSEVNNNEWNLQWSYVTKLEQLIFIMWLQSNI